jgi:hypothetical protein
MHSLLVARSAVSSLFAVAVAATVVGTLVVALRMPQPPTVVVVPIAAPVVQRTAIVQPGWCYGYDWRRSSVDLRMYCGFGD